MDSGPAVSAKFHEENDLVRRVAVECTLRLHVRRAKQEVVRQHLRLEKEDDTIVCRVLVPVQLYASAMISK